MGSNSPLPYMNGWVVLIASFSLLYLLAKVAAGNIIGAAILAVAMTIGTVFPAPLNGYLSSGIAVLAAGLTLGIKLLDAPLGSGRRFRKLEGQLAQRPGVKNPAALAASIGRKKYGAQRFQRLSIRGRKRHA